MTDTHTRGHDAEKKRGARQTGPTETRLRGPSAPITAAPRCPCRILTLPTHGISRTSRAHPSHSAHVALPAIARRSLSAAPRNASECASGKLRMSTPRRGQRRHAVSWAAAAPGAGAGMRCVHGKTALHARIARPWPAAGARASRCKMRTGQLSGASAGAAEQRQHRAHAAAQPKVPARGAAGAARAAAGEGGGGAAARRAENVAARFSALGLRRQREAAGGAGGGRGRTEAAGCAAGGEGLAVTAPRSARWRWRAAAGARPPFQPRAARPDGGQASALARAPPAPAASMVCGIKRQNRSAAGLAGCSASHPVAGGASGAACQHLGQASGTGRGPQTPAARAAGRYVGR